MNRPFDIQELLGVSEKQRTELGARGLGQHLAWAWEVGERSSNLSQCRGRGKSLASRAEGSMAVLAGSAEGPYTGD